MIKERNSNPSVSNQVAIIERQLEKEVCSKAVKSLFKASGYRGYVVRKKNIHFQQ